MRTVISVVIPTLNEEVYLPRLLNDLKEQTEKNFEVVVVDGRSKDRTKERAMEFKNDLHMRFVEAPKAHLSLQRNFGAEKAEGQYLFFLDADTRLDSDVIKKLLAHIQKEQGRLYLPYIKPTNPLSINKFLFSLVIHSVELLQKVGKPLSFGPLILIEKELFQTIGGYDLYTTASEDHNLIIKAHKLGISAKILKDVSVYYSTRRLDSQGVWPVIWQYTLFTAETLFKGGVYRKSVKYEMGGQNYNKPSVP